MAALAGTPRPLGPRRARALHRAFVGAAAIAMVTAGCGDEGAGAGASAGGSRTITVLAAASLTEAFTEMGRQFEASNPVDVRFGFGASSSLAQQVVDGAPADVLATADEQTIQRVADRHAQPPAVFAQNRLAIAVRRGNPERIESLADLARPGLVVVLCAPEVSCGRLAREATGRASVEVPARSFEPDVKGVVSKISLGEADAGIVYVTDIRATGQLDEVAIPPEHNVTARYPIVPVRGGKSPQLARAFIEHVRSPSGRAVLAEAGFQAP